MKVNGFFKDLSALKKSVSKRRERITDASPKPLRHDPIKALARILHPEKNALVISSILDLSPNVKIIKLTNKFESEGRFPIFQCGQYLSLKIQMEDICVSRPCFISSPPFEALPKDNIAKKSEPYIEIVVEKRDDGIVSEFIWNKWKIGTEVDVSFPHGKFFYEPLRDSTNLVALAEDIGIAPFYSMIKEIFANKLDVNLTVIYRKTIIENTILLEELKKLVDRDSEKLKLILLDDNSQFENAIINLGEEEIKRSTFFICGTQTLYESLASDLTKLNVDFRRIRKQIYGKTKNIYEYDEFPKDAIGKIIKIKIVVNGEEKIINALSNETILASLEKAGIKKDSHCRTGECGYCRSRIIKGDIFVNPLLDTRRIVDIEYGYFHPCISYPVSELVIDILN